MIYKCKNCEAALRFDAARNRLICDYCGETYPADMGETSIEVERANKQQQEYEELNQEIIRNNSNKDYQEDSLYMNCNIYKCTSCGAELQINNVESSSFCAYCGQPTIVFSRVSKELKPKYIIPFSISKQQAVGLISEAKKHSVMAPQAVRKVNPDKVCGVYIPYWVCNADYADQQFIKSRVGGKHKRTIFSYRMSKMKFTGLSMDASRRLLDEASQRLEPFHMDGLVKFTPEYMVGTYADRYDVTSEEAIEIAEKRAKEYFDDEVKKSISGSDIELLNNNPFCRVKDVEYALFPVWFLTYNYGGELFTYMVNGQTGKVVGSEPVSKAKAILTFVISLIPFLYLSLHMITPETIKFREVKDFFGVIIMFGMGCLFLISMGRSYKKHLFDQIERSKSKSIFSITRGRVKGK